MKHPFQKTNNKKLRNSRKIKESKKKTEQIKLSALFFMGWMMGLEPMKKVAKGIEALRMFIFRRQFHCHFWLL